MKRNTVISLIPASILISLTNITFANSDYEQWLRKTQDSFQEYKDKRDKEFTSFLKQQWKDIYIQPEVKKDNTPKPTKVPVLKSSAKPDFIKKEKPVIVHVPKFEPIAIQQEKISQTPEVSVSQTETKTIKKPVEVAIPESFDHKFPDIKIEKVPVLDKTETEVIPPTVKVEQKPVSQLPPGRIVTVSFFGSNLKFSYDPGMNIRNSRRIDKNMISDFWSKLSRTDYEILEKQFSAQRKPLSLNDWGYVLLVNKVAKEIYPDDSDSASMFTWFYLVKAGYMARIAYDDQHIYLLLPSKQIIKQSHFTFSGVKYYPLNLENGAAVKTSRVKTYDGQYPGADSRLNMQVSKAINTGRESSIKTLSFTYGRKKYDVNVNYDRNTVNFFNTYPAMDYDTYFLSDVNEQTGHPLLVQLGKIIDGKSEEEAVNILMRFTQTAFQYKDDTSQFGTENYLFPEETLHYTYSDCEDRVFMFAWLVKNLTGLKVVGLKYPGHFSAAVKFNEKVSGQSVSYQGGKYMITEPTYKGGRVGQAPPQHKKASPTIAAITS